MPGAGRTVYIVPHTHWDREWYETYETFRGQLVLLWDQLLTLTEADPDFRFLMDGQSVVIDDYLEIRPEARDRLERAVRRGQIQVGPWYTLPDEFLVSGETLVRNLQRGLASADAHGGSMRVGYLPDTFGHAAQMPQIYRQFGFRYAAIWRGVPLSIDRVAFLWKGPDGSEVLTAYMGNSYSHGVNLPTDVDALRNRITEALESIEPFQPSEHVLLMNGNDHVLPQAALSAAVHDASDPRSGTVIRLARLDDYLATLPEEGWPAWQGELRSSARANILMGTLSVRAPDKQLYARASRTLERLAEPLAALSGVDAREALQTAWTLVLQNAAHDTACGSGIDAVAEASRRRSEAALRIAKGVINRCLPQIAGEGQLWNPSPFPRRGVIELNGKPALSGVIAGCSPGDAVSTDPGRPVTVGDRSLENAALRVELHPDATLSVLDKRHNLRYSGLHRLVDQGDAGDEYNFSPVQDEPDMPLQSRNLTCAIVEAFPARGRIEASFEVSLPSGIESGRQKRRETVVLLPIRLQLSMDADSSRLDLAIEMENRATDHRLRVHFPLPFAASRSAADTPFHVTQRPAIAARRDAGAPEVELPTYPMRSFVDVSDGRIGMALITDGLHEYEVLPGAENALALTLLRAVGWLSREDLTMRTGHAGPALEAPGAQVLGSHRFRYSLFFHSGNWQRGNVWREAESALLPLQRGRGPRRDRQAPVIELAPACLQLTACVPTDDGYHLRLLNAADERTQAIVRLAPAPTDVSLVTLAGERLESVRLSMGRATFELRPWEIATLRVRR